MITKHGRAVARLVPATQDCHVDRESLAQQILKTRQGVSLGADWKSLRDQGRK